MTLHLQQTTGKNSIIMVSNTNFNGSLMIVDEF